MAVAVLDCDGNDDDVGDDADARLRLLLRSGWPGFLLLGHAGRRSECKNANKRQNLGWTIHAREATIDCGTSGTVNASSAARGRI